MADPFSILVANLNALGFFGFLLPWIFMFAVTYGLLAKAKFFEDTKIVGVISLVLAFFVVGFGGPWLAGFFVNLFGYAAVIIAGLLVIVLFITMSGGSVGKFFDNIRKIELILDSEKDKRYSAEMIVSATRGQVLVCHTSDQSATAALDVVLDKMERQLTRFKEKLREKHNGDAARKGASRVETEPATGDSFGDLWW